MINSKQIEAELDIPTLCFDNLTSTNTYAADNDFAGEIIIAADSQSEGRGRIGRSFFSPYGGLYFSYAYTCCLEDLQLLTLRAAVAVSKSIDELCGVRTLIKWVNDIYLDDKKVCGILCEYKNGRIIIGVGINFSIAGFPAGLSGSAGFVPCYDASVKEQLICSIVKKIKEHQQDPDVLEYYRSRSVLTGKKVFFILNGKEREGLAEDIADNGNLIVQTPQGRIELCSGEVSAVPSV